MFKFFFDMVIKISILQFLIANKLCGIDTEFINTNV